MKKFSKVISIILLVCSLAAMLSVNAWAAPATSATITASVTSIDVGETVTFDVTFNGDVTGTIGWHIDGYPSVVANAVESTGGYTCTVTGVAPGTATAWVEIDNGSELGRSQPVTVTEPTLPPPPGPVYGTISGPNSVEAGKSAVYSLVGSDIGAPFWSVIAGSGQATIDPNTGNLTGVNPGTIYVRAAAKDYLGRDAVINDLLVVVTEPVPLPSIQINGVSIVNPGSLYSGTSNQIYAKVNGVISNDVIWSVIDGTDLGSIDPNTGVLTLGPASYGRSITIKAVSKFDATKYDTLNININAPYVEITSSNGSSIPTNGTTQLTAVNHPFGSLTGWTWAFTDSGFANYAVLSWDGSNQATLKITQPGKSVTVQAVDQNGYKKTITISSSNSTSPATKQLTLSEYSVNLQKGGIKQIEAWLDNLNSAPDSQNVTAYGSWSSTNTAVAQVSGGKITGVGIGNATIACSYYDNATGKSYTATCYVTVTAPSFVHAITNGNYATFDGKNPLTFITNDTHYNFKGVYVDNVPLTNGVHYLEQSSPNGYIQVSLNPAYMAYLSSSNYHTIQILSTNGPAVGYFRTYGVSYNIYGVKTGDESNPALWAALCLLSFAGATAIIIKRRKDLTA